MRLLTLGGLRLDGGGLERPKPLLLLAYLALEGSQPRRDLAGLFFPDSRDALDALSTTLRRLRPLRLVREGEGRLETHLDCDAAAYRELARSGDPAAAQAYTGAFVAGLALRLRPELEEWVLETREGLAASARGVLLALAQGALLEGDRPGAARLAEGALAVAGAAPPEAEELARLHAVLERAGSPLAARVRAEAASLGLSLTEGAVVANNLPRLLTSFVGRDPERLEIAGVLRRGKGRLVTVHGPGGVGKTRLALQVAFDGLEGTAFEDGVFFVPLDGLARPDGLSAQLAAVLGLPLPPAEDPLEALARRIGNKRLLLVLDTFEHLIEAGPALSRLLALCQNLALVVTSRERLNLKAEWVLTLEGLAVPPAGATLEEARAADAVHLFLERARQARLGHHLGPESLPDVARVCALVSGYPLGIELAAAWTKAMTIAELASSLEANAPGLATPLRDVRERHRSVRAAFEHSWRLLGPEEREALRRLSVFQGGFTPEAALEVAGATRETLAGLADKSLVQVSAGRYGFHALLHGYVRRKLGEDGAVEVEARHAAYFVGRLHALNVSASGGASPELLAFMVQEEGNVSALIGWALRTRHFDELALLAEPVLWHLPMRGRIREGFEQCREIVAALPEDDPAARTALVAFTASYGWYHLFTGELEEGVRQCERAVHLASQGGDDLQVMRAHDALGQAYYRAGAFDRAPAHLLRALGIAHGLGDSVRVLRVLANLGLAYGLNDELERAETAFAEARALYEGGVAPKSLDAVWLFTYIGLVSVVAGKYGGALDACREAERLAELANTPGQVPILHALSALALLERGLETGDGPDLARAEALCAQTLPRTRASGEMFAGTLIPTLQGRLALERGEVGAALALLRGGFEAAWQSRNGIVVVWALPYLIEAFAADGSSALAGELLGFVLGHPGAGAWVRARALRGRARLAPLEPPRLAALMAQGAALSLEEVAARVIAYGAKHSP